MSRRAPDGVSSSPDQYSCWRGQSNRPTRLVIWA